MFIINGTAFPPTGSERYVKFKKGSTASASVHLDGVLLEVEFVDGMTSSDIAPLLNGTVLVDVLLKETGNVKLTNPSITTPKFTLKKLSLETHIFEMIVLSDLVNPFEIYEDSHFSIVLIRPDSNPLDALNQLNYYQVVTTSGSTPINVKISVRDYDVEVTDISSRSFNSKDYYDDYCLSATKVLSKWKDEFKSHLESDRIDLLASTQNEQPRYSSHILYKIVESPKPRLHKFITADHDMEVISTVDIQFEFRTVSILKLQDFQRRFSNMNLVLNFTQFRVTDCSGIEVLCAVEYDSIKFDFDHTVEQSDESGKYAFTDSWKGKIHFIQKKNRDATIWVRISKIIMDYFTADCIKEYSLNNSNQIM